MRPTRGTVENLNSITELDVPFVVHADGTVTDAPAGVYAPEVIGDSDTGQESMRLHFTTDDGQTVSLDVNPGDNVWITPDNPNDDAAGSLYLSPSGSTLSLGAVLPDSGEWDYTPHLDVA